MTGGLTVVVSEGARLAAASGGRQGVHPLHVPGHRDEAPLTLDLVKATQEELTEAHHRFDDAEHRFRNLLAQGIELLAFGRLQTMAHGRERRRVLRRRRCFGKALRQGRMMRLAAQRNHRIDLCRSAQRHIGVAEVTVVRQQCLRLSQIGRQCLDPLQHRLDLLLVVGGLNHLRGDHEKAVGCHHRLSVVALLEPAARHRHDARLFVGQIDLIGWQRTFRRGLGRLAAGLLAGGLGLRLPRRQLGLMLGLLSLIPLLGPGFELGAGLAKRFSRRANSSGIDMPSGTSALSAASARANNSATSAFNCASILPACSYDNALCRLALAWILVPYSATVPILSIPLWRDSSSTCTNSLSISLRKRRRNVAIVSWSGWSFAAMKRNATESYVARSSFRLEKTPVAYPYTRSPSSSVG